MAKKQQGSKKKKKEFFFNFARLRKVLPQSEKDRLIAFFTKFRSTFKELQGNLFKLNQKFDSLELQVKSFQSSRSKAPVADKDNELELNEEDFRQLLSSPERDEQPKKRTEKKAIALEDYQDNFFEKDSDKEDEIIQNIMERPDYTEKYFDFKSFSGLQQPSKSPKGAVGHSTGEGKWISK